MARPICLIVSLATAMTATAAIAADYLETVVSPVFETKGDRAALAKFAASCLAQNAGLAGPTIQTDVEGGTVVGPILFPYSSAGVPWSVRSTLTVDVKDGRFRITTANFTHKQGGPAVASSWSIFNGSVDQATEGGWTRVFKGRFGGSEKVESEAQALSKRIAGCVQAKAEDNW